MASVAVVVGLATGTPPKTLWVRHADVVTSASFVIRRSASSVDGWASQPLPFEPKGWMVEYRGALRTAILGLDATEGRVLVARFASAETRPCDVENLLLYNVGLSTFAHLRTEEIVLTRTFSPAVPPEGDARLLVHHHHYEVTRKAGTRSQGGVVARLPEIALRRPITIGQVWYDVRTAGVEVERADTHDRLALRLTVHRPSDGPAMLGMIKVLVDGVVSALHSHDGTDLDMVAARLGQRLGVAAADIASLLTANPAAALGTRRLLWPFRDFVQWNPADDQIVELHVQGVPSSSWRLSGMVTSLVAVQ